MSILITKQYKEANKGSTIGFNPADAKIEFQNKLTDLRNRVQSVRRAGRMTAAERDQINALKKELGVD
jgi:protein-arginine kinase activator protein McsA